MGYLHIDNLYKSQEILAFRECYAMEKIHGTSAHISYDGVELKFFSGGESHERFMTLFNKEFLLHYLNQLDTFSSDHKILIYGEAYGGKQQGMSKTYGPNLKFIVFDVKIGDSWLSVPNACDVATKLGLEFVDYALIPTEIEAINAERDKPSTQAKRNGIEGDKPREGVVLRPVFEVTLNNGKRLIVKHKRDEFRERASIPEIDPAKREILANAEAIANEWVTAERVRHVVNTIISGRDNKEISIKDTGLVIKAMVEDVTREAQGEIVDNPIVRKAIGAAGGRLFKQMVTQVQA